LQSPATSPNKVTTPTIRVSGVVAGNTVNLYSDSICTTEKQIATGTVSVGATSIDLTTSTLESQTPSKIYKFYAKTLDANSGSTSACSTAFVNYELDNTNPMPISEIKLGTNPASSPSNVTTPAFVVEGVDSGATVELYANDNCSSSLLGSGVESSGKASIVVNAFTVDGSYSVYGKVKDLAGNSSTCSATPFTYVLDRLAPSAPTGMSLFSPQTPSSYILAPQISVTGVNSGDIISLFKDTSCQTTPLASATATGTSITLKTSNLSPAGNFTIYSQSKDLADNSSACTSSSNVKVDYTLLASNPPVAPTGMSFVTPSTSPNKEVSPTIKVSGVRAGEIITLFKDNACSNQVGIGTVPAASNTVDIRVSSPLTTGTYNFAAKATDSTTNSSECSSATLSYELHATPPNMPSSIALVSPLASPGNSNKPTLRVSGVVSGNTVGLYSDANCNTQIATGTASGTTINFDLTSSPLTGGAGSVSYKFYAKTSDPYLNTSDCSTNYLEYVLDTTPPSLPSSITLMTPNSSTSNVRTPTYKAVGVEPGTKVELRASAICSASVIASGNESAGNASLTLNTLTADGTYQLYMSAVDLAGNVNCNSTQVVATYVLDTTLPSMPTTLELTTPTTTPNFVSQPKITVKGVAAGDTVNLYSDNCVTLVASDTVAEGATSVTIESSSIPAGTNFSFHAKRTNSAGNTSQCSTNYVNYKLINTTAPNIPSGLTLINPASTLVPSKVNIPTVQVSGVVEGDIVTLYTDSSCNQLVATGTVPASSTTVNLTSTALSPDQSYKFYAKSTNPYVSANSSACSSSSTAPYTLDTTAPPAPNGISLVYPSTNLSNVTKPELQVSGVNAKDTIKLYTSSTCEEYPNNTLVASGVVSDGSTTINLISSALTQNLSPGYKFYSKATDPAGNSSGCSTATLANHYVLDTSGPFAPSNIILSSPSSAISKVTTPSFSITGLEAGVTVELYSNGSCSTSVLGSAVESSGVVNITISALTVDNIYTIYARSKDTAGNNSLCSNVFVNYTLDRIAPNLPSTISLFAPSTPSGSLVAPKFTVGGLTVGDTVELYKNSCADLNNRLASVTATSATMILTSANLTTTGNQDFYAKAIDLAGNSLGCSTVKASYNLLSVSIPETPINLSLVTPSTSPGIVNTPTIQVRGVVAGNTVILYRDSLCSQQVAVGTVAAGASIIDLTTNQLTPATYSFYAKAIDPASNSSQCSTATVEYTLNNNAIPATPSSLVLQTPSSSPSNSTTPIFLVGGLEAGVRVELYADSTCSSSPINDSTLSSSLEAAGFAKPQVKAGILSIDKLYTVYAKARNPSNNTVSLCSSVFVNYVLKTTKPPKPTVAMAIPASGATSPVLGNLAMPTVAVSGVFSGYNVKLFANSSCAPGAEIASGTVGAVGSGLDGSLTKNLTPVSSIGGEGLYTFYANTTDLAGNVSDCSGDNPVPSVVSYKYLSTKPSQPSAPIYIPGGTPSSSPSSIVKPIFRVNNVGSGNTVFLYSDPLCTAPSQVASMVSPGNSLEIQTDDLSVFYTPLSILSKTFNLYARQQDQAGNWSDCSSTYLTYILDRTPSMVPSAISMVTNLANANVGKIANPTLKITFTNPTNADADSVVKIYADSNSCSNTAVGTANVDIAAGPGDTTVNITLSTNLAEGNHILYAQSQDALGNKSSCSTASYAYNLDLTNPTSPVVSDDGTTGIFVSRSPTVTWSASTDNGASASGLDYYEISVVTSPGGVDVVSWTKLSNVLTGFANNITPDLTNLNTYVTKIRAVDKAGNVSTAASGDGWTVNLPLTTKVTGRCAIKTGGSLWCWGDNTYGQVGDGTQIDRSTPVMIFDGGVTAVAESHDHTTLCAIKSGALFCWGNSAQGQTGNNNLSGGNQLTPITPVGTEANVTSVVISGDQHTCAIINGGLKCWGYNGNGQLGTGDTTNRYAPFQVYAAGAGVTSVSVGQSTGFTCAIKNAALFCWGYNAQGQLCNGGATQSLVPVASPYMTSGATSVSLGNNHGCAIVSGGVQCWGYNTSWYYLGLSGTVSDQYSPNWVANVAASSGVSALKVYGNYACAIQSSTLKCWGDNGSGQVGNGTSSPVTTGAYATLAATSVTSFNMNSNSVCAIQSGALKCWGYNLYSNLGINNAINPITTPTTVAASGATDVAFNGNTTCAVLGGALKCWGSAERGQVSNGQVRKSTPTNTTFSAGSTNGILSNTVQSGQTRCAIQNGALYCWGYNNYGQIGAGDPLTTGSYIYNPYQVFSSGVTDVKISYSGNSVCAIKSGGLYCWGYNGYGQIGLGGTVTTAQYVPYYIFGDTNFPVTAVALNHQSICAIKQGGLFCAGYNVYGQLGVGDATQRYLFTAVSGMGINTNVTSVVIASTGYVCAIQSAALYCWGYNANGELGLGDATNRTTPTPPHSSFFTNSNVTSVKVSLNGNNTCALQNGGLKCWGVNSYGLGDGITTSSNVPISVTGLTTGVAYFDMATNGNSNHICAVMSVGTLYCWGLGTTGQLGDGTSTSRLAPVQVNNLSSGVSKVFLGTTNTCAITNSGALYCWGLGTSGQLGNGSLANSSFPNGTGPIINSGVMGVNFNAGTTTCAVVNGEVKCWGANNLGQVGDFTGVVATPTTVAYPQ
jgi:alpha-tubulin suppressor-like RCC1 family protein